MSRRPDASTSRPRVKRVYDAPSPDDGTRVLVDRVWPRGLRKDDAHLDEWLKTVAPTTELRKWFGHVPERYDEFVTRYANELDGGEAAAALEHLRELAAAGPLTLLTATKQWQISQAAVLVGLLTGQAPSEMNDEGEPS
ncbi:hypothetical protein BA895_17890 [Humibacillus sp. DSM 29435]|uniref:DUF488 domain-containing protein n=1 Tax=Humibacillus sp. DSM 29435 TaxID=1869167 RepID=UPI000871B55B|nr:DUF488 family protein [Humibacillus sp. DSM 29435]OFE17052.1 hypothetical protein BA895_17890 [Humibacillus sp. DSM 29435]